MTLRSGRMAGSSSGPPGGPRHVLSGGGGRQPQWMRSDDDIGSMVLLLRRRTTDDEAENNSGRVEPKALPNPFIVGTSIELAIGSKVEASREGRGTRYILRTSSKTVFNKLLKITELTDGTQVEIISHPTLNTVQGTVYDQDSKDMDETEIQGYLCAQGVHTVRRLKKRVNGNLQNTPLLVLSFHGTELPNFVYFGLLRIPVNVYYPYPLICFNCGTYGHSKKLCQNRRVCLQCSRTHTLTEGEKCQNPPHCPHCNDGHSVISRDCPKYKSEEKIIRIKIDQQTTFTEARRIYAEETKKSSFADVVQDRLNRELEMKDKMIATLQKQVTALAKELADLKNALKPKSHSQSPAPASSSTTSDKKSGQSAQNRMSRKDKSFISPPAKKSNCNDKNSYDLRNRSRSGKRAMEISPTTDISLGKRSSTHPININFNDSNR